MGESCCKCGMFVDGKMVEVRLKLKPAITIENLFCPVCFQEAFVINDEDMEDFLRERLRERAARRQREGVPN